VTGILTGLLVIALLLWILRFIVGGGKGRVGRPPTGFLTRFKDPRSAPLPAAALGGYALASALVILDPTTTDVTSGIMVGVVVAVALAVRAIERYSVLALGFVGLFCGVVVAHDFVFHHRHHNDPQTSTYRAALMLLIFACFVAATVLFDRAAALHGERGLALLGIVDVVTFLASPRGFDTLSMSPVNHGLFVLGACAAAFLLGAAVSEATLGLVAMAVLVVDLAFSKDNHLPAVVAALSAVVLTAAARRVLP
jgi:hypothetical protein